MKRIFMLFMSVIMVGFFASAQNANRKGLFLEAGIGGLIGNTPRTTLSVNNNVVQYECLTGTALNLSCGRRSRINKHWTYELQCDFQIPFEKPSQNLILKILPLGFRYYSSEFFKNYSLYCHFNVGGAATFNSGVISYIRDLNLNNPTEDVEHCDYSIGGGIAYLIGVGVNLTTRLYIEGRLSSQLIFNGFGKDGKGLLHYGMPAGVIGYRF